MFNLFSEVRVGELDLKSEEDCQGNYCGAPPQDFVIEKVIKHQKWDISAWKNGFDIALVRIRGNIKFFHVSYHLKIGSPCKC